MRVPAQVNSSVGVGGWLSLLGLASGCAWSHAQPTFLVQLTHVARARDTPEARLRAGRLTLWAGISMALERHALPEGGALAPQTAFGSGALDAAPLRGVPIEPERSDCARPDDALCAWARSAEETALSVALQQAELAP